MTWCNQCYQGYPCYYYYYRSHYIYYNFEHVRVPQEYKCQVKMAIIKIKIKIKIKIIITILTTLPRPEIITKEQNHSFPSPRPRDQAPKFLNYSSTICFLCIYRELAIAG